MANIGVYNGSPTAGGTNGTLVDLANFISPGSLQTGTGSEVVTAPLKLAVRCINTGDTSASSLVISLTGTSTSKWALAPDNSGSAGTFGAYGASLNVGTVGATNTIFWIRARATTDELVSFNTDDLSVSLSMSDAVISTSFPVGRSLTQPYSILSTLTPVGASLTQPYTVAASVSAVGASLSQPYAILSNAVSARHVRLEVYDSTANGGLPLIRIGEMEVDVSNNGSDIIPTNAAAFASSEFSSGYLAANIRDNSLGSEWAAAYPNVQNEWIQIPLGASYSVTNFRIYCTTNTSGNFPATCKLFTSNVVSPGTKTIGVNHADWHEAWSGVFANPGNATWSPWKPLT